VEALQDAIAGFQEAPLWAQIAMVLFAMAFVAMMVGPSLTRRKHRRHFAEIVRGLDAEVPANRDWPFITRIDVAGRSFQLRHDLRSSSRHSSYRGPTGHVLITATRLAGTRWSMHQVDLQPVAKWLSGLASRTRRTGDAEFDGRFIVREDGLPARESWLDAPTRQAITHFFATAPKAGALWIREGDMQFLIGQTWTDLDAPAVRRVMEAQAVLADALDRTARIGVR
jgi:hypothetical protein